MPSTHYRDPWNSSKACRTCSKGNFNHSCTLSVSFDDFLIYQLMKKLSKSLSLSGRVWKRFKCVTPGIEPEKLTFRAAQVSSSMIYFYFQYIYDARLLFWLYIFYSRKVRPAATGNASMRILCLRDHSHVYLWAQGSQIRRKQWTFTPLFLPVILCYHDWYSYSSPLLI